MAQRLGVPAVFYEEKLDLCRRMEVVIMGTGGDEWITPECI